MRKKDLYDNYVYCAKGHWLEKEKLVKTGKKHITSLCPTHHVQPRTRPRNSKGRRMKHASS